MQNLVEGNESGAVLISTTLVSVIIVSSKGELLQAVGSHAGAPVPGRKQQFLGGPHALFGSGQSLKSKASRLQGGLRVCCGSYLDLGLFWLSFYVLLKNKQTSSLSECY